MTKTETDAKKAAKRLRGKPKEGTKHLVILMDESGSMTGLQEAVVTGCNEFLHSFRGDDVLVTLAWFDHHPGEPQVRFKIKAKPIAKVKELTIDDYRPRGTTPLNDAIVATISFIDRRVDDPEDTTVFMAIITDGLENASETSAEDVAALIKKREGKQGWGFVYLGANQHAESVAAHIGLTKKGQAFNFAASYAGTRAVTHSTSDLAHAKMASGPGMAGSAVYDSLAEEKYDQTGGVIKEEEDDDE